MQTGQVIAWGIFLLLMIWALVRASRSRGGRIVGRPGPGAVGSIYDMLNQDKRNAIEMIVEERAEARDPETADEVPPDAGRGSGP